MNLKRISSIIILFFFLTNPANAQNNGLLSKKDYIENYKDLAVKEMLRSGIPASITLAQGMLESQNGNSTLAKKANNHFGIKCHNTWTGKTIKQDDDKKGECFRKYKTVYESYKDHTDFLMSGSRYGFLFKLQITDYKGWAKGLKKAGYATNPDYPEMLIRIIEDNDLQQYDLKGASVAEKQKIRKKLDNQTSGTTAGREILVRNRVKYIIVKPDDTFRSLQEEFDLLPFEIYKYNDLARDQELKAGQVLYLQPKRNRAEVGNTWHTVKEGETMQEISQKYAVKPDKLYKKNLMTPDHVLNAGDKISLRKQLPGTKPKVEKKKRSQKDDKEDESDLRFEFDK
jgi:LysM repeat protein